MLIRHYPDWRNANPYQALLDQALRENGIKVAFSAYHGFFLQMFRNARGSDVLHLHWVQDLMATEVRWSARFVIRYILFWIDLFMIRISGRRLVWTLHNTYSHNCRHRILERFAKRKLAKACDALVLHSASQALQVSQFLGVPGERFTIIPHGRFDTAYGELSDPQESRKVLNIREEEKVGLHFGTIKPYKGVAKLLEVWGEAEHGMDKLFLVGRIQDKAVKGKIATGKFSGVAIEDRFVDNEELLRYLAACDVVVLPFRDVLTSGSLVLAMSYSLPIITPRTPFSQDYLGQAYPGLYDPKSADGLSTALQEFSRQSPQQKNNFVTQADNSMEWEQIGQKTAEVYRSIMDLE